MKLLCRKIKYLGSEEWHDKFYKTHRTKISRIAKIMEDAMVLLCNNTINTNEENAKFYRSNGDHRFFLHVTE